MSEGLVISDSGPIFSLAVIDKLSILEVVFDEIAIPKAVWEEITKDKETEYYDRIAGFFKDRVRIISGFNELTFVMDYGESESVVLYREINANYLLIDDKKARRIAENLGINCIGTIGVLSVAKDKGLVEELRPLFERFLNHNRYYGLNLLNSILTKHGEEVIGNKD
ncbi:MAG: DUF3368 domain-containing protein [bacterium]|nr:DUF3368 domain-containing protein [bacterium]